MTKTKMLLSAIIMIAMVPAAMALDNESPISVDNESPVDGDLNTMNIPSGAVVRFLQLERQLDITIQRAENIVSNLTTDNTSPLREIIGELELIKEDVSEYTNEEAFNGMTVPEIAVLYIDFKNDSMSLIREFKTILHDLLTEEKINQLRERIQAINEATNTTLRQRIAAKIKEYNAERVRTMLQDMNLTNQTLIDDIMGGRINKGTIMNRIRNYYNELGQEVKVNAAIKIVQRAAQEKIRNRVAVEQALNNTADRLAARLQERLEKAQEKNNTVLSAVAQRIQQKLSEKQRGNSANSNRSGNQ